MKTVAVVGFAPSWIDAPFGNAAVDIWVMNFHGQTAPRATAIFELHDRRLLEQEDRVLVTAGQQANLVWLATAPCPVYMQQTWPDLPSSVAYPIDRMKARYTLSGCDQPYFTSTASYMLALAIEQGYEAIEVYGVDMAHDTEYGHQRPSCEFFLGVAVGQGITVRVHRHADLLKTAFLYGYEDGPKNWFRDKLRARREFLQGMQTTHAAEVAKHQQALHEVAGAIENNDHIAKVWG